MWLQENIMQALQFCHATRWNSVILTDFHFAFSLFSESETQSKPWRKGGIEGANPQGSNPKKIFTPTSVKQNCEVSHTAVCRIHFVKALKHQTFFLGLHLLSLLLSLYSSCCPPQKVRETQRKLDVVLRTLLYEKQGN